MKQVLCSCWLIILHHAGPSETILLGKNVTVNNYCGQLAQSYILQLYIQEQLENTSKQCSQITLKMKVVHFIGIRWQ